MARSRGRSVLDHELSSTEKRLAEVQEGKIREYSNALTEALGLGAALAVDSDSELSGDESTVGGTGSALTGDLTPGSTVQGTARSVGTEATGALSQATVEGLLTGALTAAGLGQMVTETAAAAVSGGSGVGASPGAMSPFGSLSNKDEIEADAIADALAGVAFAPAPPQEPPMFGSYAEQPITDVSSYLELVPVNPEEYVSATGHEGKMLFGSGKIPSVTSFCAALRPGEKGPFKSNIRSDITDAQLRQMDVIVEAQVRVVWCGAMRCSRSSFLHIFITTILA